ncbi:ATP-dependent DNA ligase [Altererythrobacter aerius]|uniref:DNA ligase (ATP) n=1 Tax=Tsuneonella aeria TaxID=1837929 RepID=A0A6I4TC59_9SPHN|nr:ATP-dependent DNA ligase [Tsuneonella aeria]MXO74921.1 ATP-dependent DNA ligase [Tsuneonella aeria]
MHASSRPSAGLEIERSTPPMEARLVDHLPEGEGWQYEPKWDGFRCLAFRDKGDVALMSRSGKPLERYFPEVAAALRDLPESRFVVDGELVVPVEGVLSFAALQARLHPAASRIAKLARQTPAQFILFDCLQVRGRVHRDAPLAERRAALEQFAGALPESIFLSPATDRVETARAWLAQTGGALDGVIAKRRDEPYRPGERAMFKHKVQRTADCVVGGFRTDKTGCGIASLLLGLYDEAGLLHQVGYSSSFAAAARMEMFDRLAPLEGASAFTGKAPGGASRWTKPGKSTAWTPLEPRLVAEVAYDQVTGDRFRHGTTFRRWRPDKAPSQCTFDQLAAELRPEELVEILAQVPG